MRETVPNERGDWMVAFASHVQNYLYNLTTGRKIKIPDRSDAVATPDGRYLPVPSTRTESPSSSNKRPGLGGLRMRRTPPPRLLRRGILPR